MVARGKPTPLVPFAWLALAVFAVSCVLAGAYHEYCHHSHAVQHASVEQLLAGCQAGEGRLSASPPPEVVDPSCGMGSPCRFLPADDFSAGVFRPPTGRA